LTVTTQNDPTTDSDDLEIVFVVAGNVADAARRRAEEVVRDLASKAPRPVIFARVKLTEDESRPPTEQHMAQATIDISGTLLRAHVAESGMIEAINLVGKRLDRRLRDLAERREDANTRPPATEPGTWRSGDLPSTRPDFFPRPPGEREILRRKTWSGERVSITDALFDLYALDHRFYLFTDASDEVDSVVYENDEGVGLRRLTGDAPSEMDGMDIDVIEAPAPEMTDIEASNRLDSSNEPFVFYQDKDTGRGAVLYRRYDGHYGLVEPRA
jgi:ribosome-associated translation inhibitor RaiA